MLDAFTGPFVRRGVELEVHYSSCDASMQPGKWCTAQSCRQPMGVSLRGGGPLQQGGRHSPYFGCLRCATGQTILLLFSDRPCCTAIMRDSWGCTPLSPVPATKGGCCVRRSSPSCTTVRGQAEVEFC
jgi:hypothetical protein